MSTITISNESNHIKFTRDFGNGKTFDYCVAYCFSINYDPCLEKDGDNTFDVCWGKDNILTISYLEVMSDYATPQDFYNYLCSIIDCSINAGVVEPPETTVKTFQIRSNYWLQSEMNLPAPKRQVFCLDGWTDQNGNWCYVMENDNPNDSNNLITISNYEKMASDKLGALPIIDSEIKTRKGRVLEICGGAAGRTVTLADVATQTAADIAQLTGLIPPDTGYEWALLGFEVNQHPAKKKIYCDLADQEGDVNSNEQASYAFNGDNKQYITIGDTKDTVVKQLPKADACGCLADRSVLITDEDFTQPLTLEPNTGIEFCPLYVCVVTA